MKSRIDELRNEPGIVKLFTLFKGKYESFGSVKGTVALTGFTDGELDAIAGLIGETRDQLRSKNRLPLRAFEKGLDGTVFAGIPLLSLMEDILGETLVTKKEAAEQGVEAEQAFLLSMQEEFPELDFWWARLGSKSPDTRWIWSLYRQREKELAEACTQVGRAFLALPEPGEYVRIPLFAQRITGNPHSFDPQQTAGRLLVHCLYADQVRRGLTEDPPPRGSEALNELFSEYGLLRDDLWSFITCQGLLADNDQGVHPVWQAAVETQTVMNVPFKEVVKVTAARPAHGRRVWIVENSSVCSTLCDSCPDAPVICTHGQIRTSGWVLLDLLAAGGSILYYSGDLDPEGLVMAQRLKTRYRDQLVFWRMDAESYAATMSDEDITARLPQLGLVHDAGLAEAAAAMQKYQKAGYQEGLIDQLTADIREN
ncbi:hypothetical protein NCCP2716_22240 [Sporosarcina sp. NCCP-2716]|uniref:TIGR02679 family protein n=1 Tax=Sporosarcina sp. NCCP-2716 TaxID=2943679 RepID=UPI00203C590A|nr:TIGR02679 family protein [Sporosarcina sp. NCCP-2716]GKV69726.1 hypothetical protein NCCP2716_22240 [Sporosarcina sp. NCCP-2716]